MKAEYKRTFTDNMEELKEEKKNMEPYQENTTKEKTL
jgi:hypothetical protein